jgi:MoaA/NifB/PqqE/SkfB family radical SAM enzyme
LNAIKFPLRVIQNRIGAVPRPSFCTYLVCNRCNARCGMCDSWKIARGYEMTPDDVTTVFEKVGRLDVVRLTGGEPFLRDDLLEIAHRILEASRPTAMHITTNGSFPDRVEAFCRAFHPSNVLRVMVSFDGLASEHDRNRGRAVTFDRALDTVRRLAKLGRKRVVVSVNHTIISNQSLADHDELHALLAREGVDVHWVLAYEDSAMYGLSRRGKRADDLIVARGYPLHPALDREEAFRFVEGELDRAETMSDPFLRVGKRYYLAGLRDRLMGSGEGGPRPKCVALRSHLRLLPDGSVPVCQFNTEVVGNLVKQPFDEVWKGGAARRSREWVDACPGCWAECEVVPNAVYSGDIVRALLPRNRDSARRRESRPSD